MAEQDQPINIRLFDAVSAGDLVAVGQLLRGGANPNSHHVLHGTTPLHDAAGAGDVRMAELLIEHGADLSDSANNTASTALGIAAIAGRAEMVRLLMRHGAKLSRSEVETGLVRELEDYGEKEIALLLRTRGIEP
jgi:ankyrin